MISVTCETEPRQYFGKYSGEVLAFEAELPEESAERGDIRVRVPGILEEDAGGQPRPLEVVAKPSFLPGFYYIPEPGEKVWVEFVAGNVDYPIWTGVWYPDGRSPATITGERPTRFQKIIRTATGHVVQLDDTDGEEKVVISHKTGSFVSIDQDGTVVVGNHLGSTVVLDASQETLVIVDQHQNSVRMTADGIGVVNQDGSAAVYLTADLARITAKDIALEGTSANLGTGADAPTIHANASFVSMWNLFAMHTHGTAMGPSGPPTPPAPLLQPGSNLTTAVVVK